MIIFAGTSSSEGSDRNSLNLEHADEDLINEISKVNKNIIVVLHVPGATVMPWIDNVKGLLCAFMPG